MSEKDLKSEIETLKNKGKDGIVNICLLDKTSTDLVMELIEMKQPIYIRPDDIFIYVSSEPIPDNYERPYVTDV